MYILGIETSCDDTGIGLYHLKKGLIDHAIDNQSTMHNIYGGIVPELASRNHIKNLPRLIQNILKKHQLHNKDLCAIACTKGPGLSGSLLVGMSVAQSMSWALNIPFIPIHHLEAHLLTARISHPELSPPFIALLVSGGHTQIFHVKEIGSYALIGETLDDAVGEAFDKTAKMMGLDYPGGPAIEALAAKGKQLHPALPRPMRSQKNLMMSFSGLKTAVSLRAKNFSTIDEYQDLSYEFQCAVFETLITKCSLALSQYNCSQLVISGGVSANKTLRKSFSEKMHNIKIIYPPLELCTDNGAMIAALGAQKFLHPDQTFHSNSKIEVKPRWPLSNMKNNGSSQIEA